MHGTIDVTAYMNQERRARQERTEWLERLTRDRLRREEADVLRRYHRSDKDARRTIVAQHKVVFDRIRANRRRAAAIARQERAAVDRYWTQRGYLIRPGPGWPRYVRPGWSGVLSSEQSKAIQSPGNRR